MAAAAAAAGAITLHAAAGVPAASAIDAPRTMTFSEPFSGGGGHHEHLDFGKKGMSAKDMVLTTNAPVTDARSGRRVGSADGVETILSLEHPGAIAVSETVRFPDGHVEIAGVLRFFDRKPALSVVGGTGAYANARGEVTIVEDRTNKRNLITLTLLP